MCSDGILHMVGARVNEHRMKPFDDGTKKGVSNDDLSIGGILIWVELGELIISMVMEAMADWVITDGGLKGLGVTLVRFNIFESNRADGIHSILHRVDQKRLFEARLCPFQQERNVRVHDWQSR